MIPAAAVDAAALAILQGVHGEATIQELAELALEAAAPHMLASPISAVEIEAVAEMLKAAKADGWDEGANADHDFDGDVTTPNPYRAAK